jgi:hypothetical protein
MLKPVTKFHHRGTEFRKDSHPKGLVKPQIHGMYKIDRKNAFIIDGFKIS